jgi:hypothetical protein
MLISCKFLRRLLLINLRFKILVLQ